MLFAEHLHFAYPGRYVLDDVSFHLRRGEIVALQGSSGSGKTTLLACLAGLIQPKEGSVSFCDVRLDRLTARERSRLRLESFGFVYQFGELVPELTLLENVELPLRLLGTRRGMARRSARELLEHLGIAEISGRLAVHVSGGEQQRAAIARALVHEPKVLFCDEPTGSLDRINGDVVLSMLVKLARLQDTAIVLATHDSRSASVADRVLHLVDGRLERPSTVSDA